LQRGNADLQVKLLCEGKNPDIAATKLLEERHDHNTTRLVLETEQESNETKHHEQTLNFLSLHDEIDELESNNALLCE
jgi:hypothetical protein